jgi:hypothetical protein
MRLRLRNGYSDCSMSILESYPQLPSAISRSDRMEPSSSEWLLVWGLFTVSRLSLTYASDYSTSCSDPVCIESTKSLQKEPQQLRLSFSPQPELFLSSRTEKVQQELPRQSSKGILLQ